MVSEKKSQFLKILKKKILVLVEILLSSFSGLHIVDILLLLLFSVCKKISQNPVQTEFIQSTTSSHRQDGGPYCEATVGGKCMVSKEELFLFAFAV